MKNTDALIASGATGGGCLVNGISCGGFWAKYSLGGGRIGHTEVLYGPDGDVVATHIHVEMDGVEVAATHLEALILQEYLEDEIEEEKSMK